MGVALWATPLFYFYRRIHQFYPGFFIYRTMKQVLNLHLFLFAFLFFCSSSFAQVTLTTDDITTMSGEVIEVDFKVAGFQDIISGQFIMNYDPAVLEYVSLGNLNLEYLTAANFGTPPDLDAGEITFAWFDENLSGVSVDDETVIFTITFNVIGADGTSTVLDIDEDPQASTMLEFADGSGVLTVTTEEGTVTVLDPNSVQEIITNDFIFYPISPNPIMENGMLSFHLNEKKETRLSIYTVSGKLLFEHSQTYLNGLNNFELTKNYFPTAGSYFIELNTGTSKGVQRVVVVK